MPRRPPKVIRPVDAREEAALGAPLDASFPSSNAVAVLDPAAERRRLQPAAQPGRPDGRSQSQPRNKDIQP
ncbi:MAG: hypothetical protein B7Y86_05525 [Brevundimonas subvibrioides]|uniref:Uncharacterized protein n=1 Tax=Brevundimonas subvibrioides TaxID=74313 RepID=A0A258HLV2_9CAUL|nr:hypothetical protein [Brevundimonas subvibrioides]OYX57597.1 MAG: hypothetical protein B7Y86_05525 [Brevundimonas subvibrioides]